MTLKSLRIAPAIAAALLLGACASDNGGLFSTASVTSPVEEAKVVVASKPRIDPGCVTLATQIDGLRKEGTIDRLEKVAAGKGDKVQVKRTAIAKQAELNKANADFQLKCAPRIPATQDATAPAAPAPVAAAAAAAAVKAAPKVAATAAKAAQSGVTIAAPAVKTQ